LTEAHAQLGWVVAIVAGVLSFVSPCILPLIPGYLSMISGVSAEQIESGQHRQHLGRILVSCALFSLGFTIVFLLLGASAGVVGHWLRGRMVIFNVIFGIVVIIFGLFVLNVVKLPFLYRDRRFRYQRTSVSAWAAPVMGIAFGFGWTPCIGPFLATLYTIAANLPTAQATALFGIYSITLGICFVIAGMAFAYALKTFSFIQRHYRVVELLSGSLLVLIGVLLVTQQWTRASSLLMRFVG
jgi:cytochrome c-type biogenesis protein